MLVIPDNNISPRNKEKINVFGGKKKNMKNENIANTPVYLGLIRKLINRMPKKCIFEDKTDSKINV